MKVIMLSLIYNIHSIINSPNRELRLQFIIDMYTLYTINSDSIFNENNNLC